MLGLLLDYLLFRKLNHATRGKLVEGAFFTFNGIILGVLINDIFKMFGGQTFNQTPVGFNFLGHEMMKDELYGYMISSAVSLTGIIPLLQIYHKWTNNIALSIGMNAGVAYANLSEAGKYVGFVQEPK